MIENITEFNSGGMYGVITIYSLSVIISTLICLLIIYVTCVTPHLHTPTNLLVINTCLCTLAFSGVSTLNSFFFFIELTSTDWSCRIRGYLSYVTLCLVNYSLVIQAISRLFWTVLYKYRHLLTMKCHVYLILIELLLAFLFPSTALITSNITFRSFKLCFVSIQYTIHCIYLLSIIYCIPIVTIILLYSIIYYKTTNASLNARRLLHGANRDRELARNIIILLGIFLFGGVPLCIYVLLSSRIESLPTTFYLVAITTPAIAIILEKVAIVALNTEIRKVIVRRWTACHSCNRSGFFLTGTGTG